MKHVEKIYNSNHYWEEHPYGTLDNKQLEDLNSTNITEEVALECFDRKNWWYPDPHKNPHFSDYIPDWGINSFSCSDPKFILFDSLDGETQIIRQLEFINPQAGKFRESQRIIYNPKTGFYKPLRMPRNDMNPYQVSHPFYGTKLDYIKYSLGGYNNIFNSICLGGCFFYFRELVPGIKREEILKRNLSMVYNYGEMIKGPGYLGEYNRHLWICDIAFKSLITGNSLFEILWEIGLKDRLYNGSSSTKEINLGFLENHKRSFLISRRNGVDFRNIKTLLLWMDTINLLKKYEMDIKSPKYIAKELKETHDLLVARENRKAQERIRAQRREEQLRKEYWALEEKERLQRDEKTYLKEKGKYLGWQREKGDMKIIPVQSVSDCLEVGVKLSNCCYSAGYYKLRDSLLLKIYVSGVLTELAQIGVNDKSIYQCYGYGNKKSKDHTRILNFLEENIKDLP